MNTTLCVGLIQATSIPGKIQENLAHATPLVEQAASQGAELVLLPELYSCGYIPNQSIWQYGELQTGLTYEWVRETAKGLNIHLGVGYLECDGRHFYNSYVLADSKGQLLGNIRKRQVESYCFKPGSGRVTIDSQFGRLGIGICADNHRSSFATCLQSESPDLLLMPHGSPAPYKIDNVINQSDVERALAIGPTLAQTYVQSMGRPVVFVNGTGPMEPMSGILGSLMKPDRFRLRGHSCIVNGDGTLVGMLEEPESVLVGTIEIDKGKQCWVPPPDFAGWIHPGNALVRKVIIPLDIFLGRLSYNLNPARRRMAQEISVRQKLV